MAQVSYGTITITDTNDIEEIFSLYGGSNDANTSPAYTYAAVTGGTIWKRNVTTITNYKYIWQITAITKTGIIVDSSNWQQFYGVPIRITGEEGDDARNIITVTPYYYLSSSDSSQTGGNWSTSPQAYPSTGVYYYWTKTITTYDSGSPSESTPVLDMFLTNAAKDARDANATAAIANSIAQHANENAQGAMSQSTETQYQTDLLKAKVKNFWWDSNGAHIASGVNGADVTKETISTYGYNALTALGGISFRYNDAKVVDLNSTTPSLDFYQPPTISGNTVTQGALAMNLSSTELTFFKPDASNTQALVINSDGVDVYGDTTGSGAALSGIKTAHFGSITTIGPTSYRHIQLSENNLYFKFSESVLGGINFSDTYRNEEDVFVYSLTRNSALNFTGSLNYNSDDYLKTGSFKITYVDTTGQTQTMSADNVDLSHTYTHTFSQTEQIPDTGIKLYQFIINFTGEWGEGLTSGDVVSPNFNLQIDSSDSATLELHIIYSARIDGPHYIFGSGSQSIGENSLTTGKGTIALGDFQFVTGKYNESDKEAIFIIGNGSDDNNRSNVFVVDKEGNLRVNNGFQIYNNDETDSIAEFGTTARIGKINNSHFLMNANSLQAYNSSNQLYFEVSNTGIRFGNNLSSTVATQADVTDASYSVEIQVTSIDYTNNSATLVAIPYYQGSTTLPTGVTLSYQWYKNGSALTNTSTAPTITGATTNTLQLGEGTDFGSSTTNAIYTCVIS